MTRILIGDRFGQLTAIKYIEPLKYKDKHRNRTINYLLCICDCGTEKKVREIHLLNKQVISCGCIMIKKSKKRMKELHTKRRQMSLSLPEGQLGLRKVFANYIRRANRYGLSFELSIDQFRDITSSECQYCGVPPSNISWPSTLKSMKKKTIIQEHGKYLYNGIDRVDNNQGYTLQNSKPCCKSCNYAKQTMSLEEFKSWLKRAYHKTFSINHEIITKELPKNLGLGLSQSEIDAMREKYSKLREMKKAVDNITKEPEKPKVSGILYNTSGILQYTNNKWYLDEPDTLTELLNDDVIHVFSKTDMKKAEKISKKDLNDSHNKAHATLMRVCQPFDLFHINITLLDWGYNILYIDQKTKTELMTRYTEEALEFAKKHNIKVDIEKAKKNLDIFFNKKA